MACNRDYVLLADSGAASEAIDIVENEGSNFHINSHTLAAIVQEHNHSLLKHFGGVYGIAGKLKVCLEAGVKCNDSEIDRRKKVYGSNTYLESPFKSFWSYLWDAMQDLMLIVLAVCAFVSIVVGTITEGWKTGWCDGGGIVLSIFLVLTVTAASDYQQSLQFRELDKEKKKVLIQVTRDSCRQKVPIHDLVVGDVVHLSVGDQVPADGLFITGYSLVIDESSMTGESGPQLKNEDMPFLMSGTKVQDGSAKMLVTGVGMQTEWGHAMSVLGGEETATPLEVKLGALATLIGKIGMLFGMCTFLVLAIKFFVHKRDLRHWSGFDIMTIINFFATAVTIIVVAVPEGLPLAVTLSLAYAMRRMMAQKALVRHLSACETMGSASCICSDKTGTLTSNQMVVVKSWLFGATYQLDRKFHLSDAAHHVLLEGILQNTSGDISRAPDGNPILIGSPTEIAMLGFGLWLCSNFKAPAPNSEIVLVEPFNSSKKKMGIIIKLSDGRFRAHWKGASEIVLSMCDKVMNNDGSLTLIDESKYWELRGVIKGLADEGLRTLCLAFKDLSCVDKSIPENGLVCMAIVGIKDPVRSGVKEAVTLCYSAGIKVRMITGDNLHTAIAIARECGILTDGDAVEGPEFRRWSSDEIRRRIPRLQVIARSSPSDKHKLVKELRAMGEIVAVTGDGTNDASALYEADIGIAMGISGTEVAKESSDIIILDDNFASIVNVAKWGRSVYVNIQKFVQFQLTVNLVALVLNFASACFKGSVPLTIVQLLWVNLIMDTMGALALATDPPNDDLMKRVPIGRKEVFISKVMWRNIYAQATYQLLVLTLLQHKGVKVLHITGRNAHEVLRTMIFNTFVFCQIFNEFNSREMEKLNVFRHINNWVFITIIAITVIVQVAMVQLLGSFANTVPLDRQQWFLSIALASCSLMVDFLTKFIHIIYKQYARSKRKAYDHFLLSNGYQLNPKGIV